MFEKLTRGTVRLTRFVFRREWLRIVIWTLSLVGIAIAVPLAFEHIYQTPESAQEMAVAMNNPAMIAMVGPSVGIDDYTTGVMNVHMMLVFMGIAIAIMNIFFVVRYTRRDEELGRQELIRSLPVGRLSPLFSTLIVAKIINITIGLGIGLLLPLLGIASVDLAGSMLYGAGVAIIGIVFAGVAAVAAQLCQTARGAIGLSMIVLIGSYILRAVGDMNSEALSLISPLGLVLRTEAAVNNHWWPIFILAGIAAILFIKALWLNAIRDMDQGFIPAKPGKAHASKLLVKPMGLSLRLMRGTIIAWLIGLVLLGASYGSILADTEAFADTIAQMTGGIAEGEDIAKAFVNVMMMVFAVLASVPCLIMMLKLRSEEKRGRLEMILASSVSRGKIFRSYFVPALVFSFIGASMTVIGLWGAGASTMETPIPFSDMFLAVMVFMPAIWVMIGLATLIIGLWPKRTSLIWAFLTFSFFILYFGNMMNLPEWTRRLTPFGYAPSPLVESTVNYIPVAITAILAIGLLIAGSLAYKHREMVEK
jgi:ABC-2 type transport system permease protein